MTAATRRKQSAHTDRELRMDITERVLRRALEQEDGAAASEYAVALSLIIGAIAVAVSLFDLQPVFQAVIGKVFSCLDGSC